MKLEADGIEVELKLPGEDDVSGEHERAAGLPREERPKIDRSVSGRQSCYSIMTHLHYFELWMIHTWF